MAQPRRFDHEHAWNLRHKDGYSVREIAELLGVSENSVYEATSGAKPKPKPGGLNKEMPASFTEMRDRAAQEVWLTFKSLRGPAKIQAFNAIRELAKQEPDGGDQAEPEPLIADVVAGVVALAPERKREILTVERERMRSELEAIDRALAEVAA